MKNYKQKHFIQRGESLLEVMISLLIFSFAILGLMGTQQHLLLQLFETESAVIANRLTANLVEEIGGLSTIVVTQLDGSSNTVGELSCPPDRCNSAWVNSRIQAWQRALETTLPDSDLMICLDNTPADGTPLQPLCKGTARLAVKIWPKHHEYPMVAALDL